MHRCAISLCIHSTDTCAFITDGNTVTNAMFDLSGSLMSIVCKLIYFCVLINSALGDTEGLQVDHILCPRVPISVGLLRHQIGCIGSAFQMELLYSKIRCSDNPSTRFLFRSALYLLSNQKAARALKAKFQTL
jgi:hypothetical protein